MHVRDLLDYAIPVVAAANVFLVLITSILKYLEAREAKAAQARTAPGVPPAPVPRKGSVRLRPWAIAGGVLMVAAIVAHFVVPDDHVTRTVTILTEGNVQAHRKDFKGSNDHSYTFSVSGRCADCGDDDVVQLFVQPPQLGPWVPQEPVVVAKGTWTGNVYIGNKENEIASGQQVIVQAVVLKEDDCVSLDKRPSHSKRSGNRGLSPQVPLSVQVSEARASASD